MRSIEKVYGFQLKSHKIRQKCSVSKKNMFTNERCFSFWKRLKWLITCSLSICDGWFKSNPNFVHHKKIIYTLILFSLWAQFNAPIPQFFRYGIQIFPWSKSRRWRDPHWRVWERKKFNQMEFYEKSVHMESVWKEMTAYRKLKINTLHLLKTERTHNLYPLSNAENQ